MKKIFTHAVIITLTLGLLAACNPPESPADIPDESAALSLEAADIDDDSTSSTLPNRESSQIESEVKAESADYLDTIQTLGWLLDRGDWESTDDLSARDMVMWYATFIGEQNASDEMYMSRYLVDGKDGFYFPQKELEDSVSFYFGIKPEQLRADPAVYDAEAQAYVTPAAVGPLAEKEIELTKIAEGEAVVLYFDLRVEGTEDVQKKALTLRSGNPLVYVSYTTKSGE